MPLPTTTISSNGHGSTASVSKHYSHRRWNQQKNSYPPASLSRDFDEATKPYRHSKEKPNQRLVLYPTMKRSTTHSSHAPESQVQSDEQISLSLAGSTCHEASHPTTRRYRHDVLQPTTHDTADEDDEDNFDRAPRTPPKSIMDISTGNSRWSTTEGMDPVPLDAMVLSSTRSSSTTHYSTIGAQAIQFIPSPPNTRRLATIESAHERLPKSSRPRHSPPFSPQLPSKCPTTVQPLFCYERIGDPCLRAFRVKLPPHLLQDGELMDDIIVLAERYAGSLPGRWNTDLYSLTKCDLACREIPGMVEMVKPVYDYICHSMRVLYGCSRVLVDKNQPHILKYSAKHGHTGGEKKK
jgi:hypothetical protein